MSILKLAPSYKDYIWGGQKLIKDFGKHYDGSILAESWELSCHPDGPCYIINGKYEGKTLSEYININGNNVLGTNCKRFLDFPILIKFIDAKDNLSIQVHPDNQYALEYEGQYGKTEMWYIVDCDEGSCLYYGFKKEIDKNEFSQRIENNTLIEVLNEVPVKKGDVFFIEAGTLHAIGKGIVIAEIQQNSNVTYRIYDYDRIGLDGKKRELHVKQALDVTCRTPVNKRAFSNPHIAECDYFTVDHYDLSKDTLQTLTGYVNNDSFTSILVLDGNAKIYDDTDELVISKGDSIFLPAGSGSYTISGSCEYLLTTVGKKENAIKVGVDIGGTFIKLGLVDEHNNIIVSSQIPTRVKLGPSAIIKDIADAILDLLQKNNVNIDNCLGIGVGCPGTINSKKGIAEYSNNINWENVDIIREMRRYLPLLAAVANDADCAAIGEWKAGSGCGCENMVLLTIGTGLGSGIIYEGKLFTGGAAGGAEIGHSILYRNGEQCTCGRKGCSEAYVSATALRREGIKAAKNTPDSLLNQLCASDLENMNAKIIFDAANMGDETASEVIREFINNLGALITDVTNIFRPEKIIIGGGVCEQGPVLINPLNKYLKEHAFGGSHIMIPEISKASLGNHAGIIGAANLI